MLDNTNIMTECDPDGDAPCCNVYYRQCGNTTEYCSCRKYCTDYKFAKQWRESEPLMKWRHDGRCGDGFFLPDGTLAECDPDGKNPCCKNWKNQCGNTTDYCSCSGCTDYKFEKEWNESDVKLKWRKDGKCGDGYRLPNGSISECDPDGENPCCNSTWDGECGNSTEHCSCSHCTNYTFVKEWNESDVKLKWRPDGKCGYSYNLPNGTEAECNPDGENPCCSSSHGGECGNTPEHCSCRYCRNYRSEKEWKESGLRWRKDGVCGLQPDGTTAECDPDGKNPCCSNWVGRCGNTTEYCSCNYCTDYKFVKEWNESDAKLKWRKDGKCGYGYRLPNDSISECDPDGGNPCCNSTWDGVCGNTADHCSCDRCTDYKFVKKWNEAGKMKWRPDGKCGYSYNLPNGTKAECDPDGENPCCSDDGECGNTTEHCSCEDCTDYKYEKEWKESGLRWRRDGICGDHRPLSDGTKSECDPDGEKPCCNDYSRCGNTTEDCTCEHCVDYRIIYRDWRNSGGKQKWRYDGWCGSDFHLPDGSHAECDPGGETPCCGSDEICHTQSYSDCFCSDCVDYRLVKTVKESGENCSAAPLYSGYVKYVCFEFDERTTKQSFKCPFSDEHYNVQFYFESLEGSSKLCGNDALAFQACGFNSAAVQNTDVLCGGYICERKQNDGHYYIPCSGDDCRTKNRNCGYVKKFESDKTCDDMCDDHGCIDESNCNGYMYGVTCVYCSQLTGFKYHPLRDICDGFCADKLLDGQDKGANNEVNSYARCVLYDATREYENATIVPLYNYTRCSVFEITKNRTQDRIGHPYCTDYLDQTNCTDSNRVGGYCQVNGHMSNVSKFVVCREFDAITKIPIKLCDDDFQNNCLWPSGSASGCRVHKHKMCDGEDDCFDGSDEIHSMCTITSNTLDFECDRRFNPGKYVKDVPLIWIMDGETDCLNGDDEDEHLWKKHKLCIGEFRQFRLPLESCKDVYKCPAGDKPYVQFDQLCDGVESCGDNTENTICRIARDFPDIDNRKIVSNNGTIAIVHDDINVIYRETKLFHRPWGEILGEPKIMLSVPTTKVDCNRFFGEHYIYLSCMDLCENTGASCPLDGENRKLNYDSCPGQYAERVYTIAGNSFLTFLNASEKGLFHQNFYRCDNGRCVDYKQVCDLVDDCGDMSDEINCTNHMICRDTLASKKHQFISLSQKCDGIYDCFDLSDECNESCGKSILESIGLKCFCWLMGLLTVLLNCVSVARGLYSLKECSTEGMMTSKVLMSLVGMGDLLIGLYLVILSVYDSIIFGASYCKNQAKWLTGTACLALGVISTIGSQLSLFSMTTISLIRMHGVKSMKVSSPVNKKAVSRVTSYVLAILTASLAVALTPLAPTAEDYFVQGMYYDPAYKIFIGFPNKDKHIKVLNSHHDENFTSDLSWKEIGEKVDGMFSHDYGSLIRRPVHFYGNDGVCLFKYFVRTDDARRSRQGSETGAKTNDPVVWTMLVVNLICFVVITVCYICISVLTRKSAESSGQHENPARLKAVLAVQRKVMLIIATDFLCWVPFIMISGMHNLDYIDASSWYATFAMTVLPFNSAINPLIYDTTLKDGIQRRIRETRRSIGLGATTASSTISMKFKRRNNTSAIELQTQS